MDPIASSNVKILGCLADVAVSMELDTHYRRLHGLTSPPPVVNYLSISAEDAVVAYQRFYKLAYSFECERSGWRVVGKTLYGMFYDDYNFFEFCCVEYPSGEVTIWKCDTPDEWVSDDFDKLEHPIVLRDDAFVNEFFEFVGDYEEE